MADRFEIGEIAEVQGLADCCKYNGTDCEVISERGYNSWTVYESGADYEGWSYEVRMHDGAEGFVHETKLRKKRPPSTPREEVGEWELCPWQPQQQTVLPSQE